MACGGPQDDLRTNSEETADLSGMFQEKRTCMATIGRPYKQAFSEGLTVDLKNWLMPMQKKLLVFIGDSEWHKSALNGFLKNLNVSPGFQLFPSFDIPLFNPSKNFPITIHFSEAGV